ncbi:MAG: NifB/NifX family molybdenum-iron cluster-binding protein [Acidobacteriota bacterium]
MSKIAVPIADNEFSSHFGGAQSFAFYVVGDDGKTITGKELTAAPPHERGAFPMWLRSQGGERLHLCGDHGH